MRTTKPPIWLLMSATVSSQMALTIFLPSLPTIAKDLGVAYGTAQLTLSIYLFAFAFAQLAVGPLSDNLGRRPMLLASLVVFTIGSVCCAISPTVETLIASRLVQACGACGGVVLGRAIVRDSRTGPEAPRAMGYMASSMALAPALSPLLGGQLLGFFGWRSNFWFTAACGIAVLVMVWRIVGETAPKAAPRTTGVVRDYLDGFRAVLRERRFIGLMTATTCASAGFNVFFSGGPILLIQVMGVAVETFGWFTLAWAGNFVVGSLVSSRLQGRVKSLILIPVGQIVLTIGALAMIATAALGYITPLALIVPLVLMGWGNGLNMPNAMANALVAVPANRVGAASALLGFVQMVTAAVLTLLVGYVPHDTQMNIGIGVAITGIVGLIGWWTLVRRSPAA
ncbi:multidrug effflux MFS transporter [uncultured Reyranella sp.]|uniref:multidrug effflux MFS transporter n=1 Tax=uncultured Reyranella sp. TaxID=735512 RepID=UPI0025D578A2|nr:multidrug effflux MFS transporter [uncultured Reyranella sp.]